ncbi:MAG: bifunctional diaminohydroxyphosphoribosylaminopyrimidine deaminase/5-amino-6-(5-phosphoribosylamino)uracil reductase RibD [Sedimentisphaerales bacterium]|nr:bifunctional diaminohydroxyphosphoribosylaminopyrimidine deaminase/5-amino-6-(5-phosphoribosylamino)uracil reductase RibD [Sedimentisphaerales bacterium]
MTSDLKYMQIALRLAARSLGNVEPNPAVGAVIVKKGKVISTGRHKKFGGLHAEINALENCRKQGANPRGATMYVTLEPCCHYGKTGPCTDAIIKAKLSKVVVATIDPSKHANGKGVRLLRKAGIKVDIGLCQNDAKILNAPFLKFAKTGKTWVTLKWAQSADGFLARTDKKRWISNIKSRTDAHKIRRRVGAVLVGINTVLKDDPLLTPMPNYGKKPVRIVLDNDLRIPLNCRLLATAKNVPVLILTQVKTLKLRSKKAKQIIGTGAELLGFPDKTKSNLKFILNHLAKLGIQHLLVEGGPIVIGSFLKEKFADEIIVYVSPKILDSAGAARMTRGQEKLTGDMRLHCLNVQLINSDLRVSGFTKNGLRYAGISGGKL